MNFNPILIGTLVVGVFCIWKFLVQPRMNEGKPLLPDENEETFADQMEKAMDTKIDF